MHDEILAYLRLHGPSPSLVLAQEFLKFKNPDENLAHVAMRGILSKDGRFSLGEDNLWRVSETAAPPDASKSLSEILWAAVYFLVLPNDPRRAAHVSVWTVSEAPELLFERWLADPASLPFEEQELLASVGDTPFSEEPGQEKAALLVRACEGRTPLFLSWRQHALFSQLAAEAGRPAPDNAVLAGTLFSCCGRPGPRPLSLDQCNMAMFGSPVPDGYAYKHGEHFALCCRELFDEMRGIGHQAVLAILRRPSRKSCSAFDFSSKAFTRDDITNAPADARACTDSRQKKFLFVYRQSSNLRRRLSGYFRESDESPDKLSRIRAESHTLVTYRCGSELESLVYEYRLIRKHSPALNRQVAIAERKGDFQPLDDCMVLLPHAEQGKGMSFWFRKNQKINMRPFCSDFRRRPCHGIRA